VAGEYSKDSVERLLVYDLVVVSTDRDLAVR
jgi:hypothetical protein